MTIKPAHKAGAVVVELDRGEEKLLASDRPPLFAIQTILVPTDFSECSRKALRYAVPLARQFGAKIVLMHAAEFQYAGSEIDDLDLPSIERQVVAKYRQRLEEMGKEEGAAGVRVDAMASVGKVVPEIISTARSTKADLVIISTHGGSRACTSDLGSTTERVVRHAPCPVLVVREKEHDFLQNESEI
jgi:nucleotide-binding universal stress UspA family protein